MREEKFIFLRKATGLVRAWSWFDAFIFNVFGSNPMMGWNILVAACFWAQGSINVSIVISTIFMFFQLGAYALLIGSMPRAGGDYIFQGRILSGAVAFVGCFTGWVLIIWHWFPIMGDLGIKMIINPMLITLSYALNNPGLLDAARWLTTGIGIFIFTLIVMVWGLIVNILGMKVYSRVLRITFYMAVISTISFIVLLLTSTQPAFVSGYNSFARFLGWPTPNAYQDVVARAAELGYSAYPSENLGKIVWTATFSLMPLVVFYNQWAQWGAPLYGEVKGAERVKEVTKSMFGANIFSNVVCILVLCALWPVLGYVFYHSANYLYWFGEGPLGIFFPSPQILAAALTTNVLWLLLIVGCFHGWFWAWYPNQYAPQVRMLLAMAFDRILPAWVGKVSERFNVPYNALIVMFIGGVAFNALYCFVPIFRTYTLDATLVLTISFTLTALAAALFPYLKPEMYRRSPAAKYKVAGIPLITICGVVYIIFNLWILEMWIVDPLYGVNNPISAIYMVGMYVITVVLFYAWKYYQKKRGIDVSLAFKEIPAE